MRDYGFPGDEKKCRSDETFTKQVDARSVVACRSVENGPVINSVRAVPDRARAVSRATRRALTVVVLLAALAACGATPSTAHQTTVEASAATGSAAVPKLLQFRAPLVGGGEFAGADYAGRATAFWFWAPT